MKTNRTIIYYIFIFIVLYLITFFVFFTSDESFFSLKRVVLLNGIFNLLIFTVDCKSSFFKFYPLLFFITAYISIISYMRYNFWDKIFKPLTNIIYPFTNGRNGFLFTFLFMFFIWIIIFIGKKVRKVII